MLCKKISAVTQFTFAIFWLSAIINGKPSNSSAVANETKENPPYLPFPNDSKISQRAESKFHRPWKVSPKNEALATKGNRSGNDSNVSSVTELMAGRGLSLFGITDSFVNPGTVLSASIENGLEKLSELVGSVGNQTFPNSTNKVSPQFFGIGSLSGDSKPFPSASSPSYPNSQSGSVQNATVAQFFGIANIFVGDGDRPPNASYCLKCPSPNVCPSSVEHAILNVSITECPSIASFGLCSLASVAPTGTLFVLYPFEFSHPIKSLASYFLDKWKKKRLSTVSVVMIRIVASTADTKLKVTCPRIPPGISVTTQNGSIQPFSSRIETGTIQLKVSGNALSSDVAAACTWES